MSQTDAGTGGNDASPRTEIAPCNFGARCWWQNLLLFLITVAGYILLFLWGLPVTGGAISILTVVPAMVGGWLFGIWGGVALGVALNLLNILLFNYFPDPFDDPTRDTLIQNVPAIATAIAAGGISGWVRQLVRRVNRQATKLRREQIALKREIEERIAAEAELAHIQQTLEQRIEQRTAELSRTNLQLQQEIAERRRVELQLQQRNRLLDRIIELGNALYQNRNQELSDLLQGIVHSLGFSVAVLNLVDLASESSQVRVRAIAGGTQEHRQRLAGAEYGWDEFTSLFTEKYRLGHSYFIPAGEFDWHAKFKGLAVVPEVDLNPDFPREEYWHADDMLLVPIRLNNGRDVGVLSVDEPLDGRRPNREVLLPLEIFADRLAGVIENARLHEQTERELARRMQAEEKIKASLQEKEVLLKEIHHRVKNNLQIISSLLNLQANTVTDPQTLAVLQESQHRVRSMALIHEKLYQSTDLAQIDFADYIKNLTGYLLRSYRAGQGTINLDYDLEPVVVGIDAAVPCGLIVNELFTNALKHAFPDGAGGEICVTLKTVDDSQLLLGIKDTGRGMPEGVDVENSASLGLLLVNALVNQLNGSLTLNRANGTELLLTLQVK